MNAEWLRSALDLVLIALVGAGLVQVTRLIWHLAGLRASRAEMKRFVHEFGMTVTRAENGIRNLKQAARESGDDLEKLIEKSAMTRDELQFIIESADQLAARLSDAARDVIRPEPMRAAHAPPSAPVETTAKSAPPPAPEATKPTPIKSVSARKEPSRAEKELMQALQKLS